MYQLNQMHIEAARNATDDFNLFHDKTRWDWINPNPFGGPIALGFQLACFVEHQVSKLRQSLDQRLQSQLHDLTYSNVELNFASVARPGDTLSLLPRVGKSRGEGKEFSYTNRFAVQANERKILLGHDKQANCPVVDLPKDLPDLANLVSQPDRTFIGNGDYFLKRKYMIVGNAKNFLLSAFVEQTEYIDEFIHKVDFPQSYPLALISSALLERARASQIDLVRDPMIYTQHKLSMNRKRLDKLRSNDVLNILVSLPIRDTSSDKVEHDCIGVLADQQVLFQARLQLMPLSAVYSRAS